jgi:hypothetical protein
MFLKYCAIEHEANTTEILVGVIVFPNSDQFVLVTELTEIHGAAQSLFKM